VPIKCASFRWHGSYLHRSSELLFNRAALLFDEGPSFQCFFSTPVKHFLFLGKLCCLRQPSFVLSITGLELTLTVNSKIKSTMAICSARLCLSRHFLDSDCFSRQVLAQNADVQRLLWFLLVLSGDLECLLLSLCYGGSISIRYSTLTRARFSLVNQLHGRTL